MRRRGFCLLAAMLVLGLRAPQAIGQVTVPEELVSYPEKILYNGVVLTVDTDEGPFTIAEAVAIRDGRFLAVGSDAQVRRLAGPATRQIDLEGKTVLPGFIDTHDHPLAGGFPHLRGLDATPEGREWQRQFEQRVAHASIRWRTEQGWLDKDEVLQQIRRVVERAHPDVEWILIGAGMNAPVDLDGYVAHGNWIPALAQELTREDLDPISPDKPLAMSYRPPFGIANTRAIEVLEKTYGQSLPGIERDDAGNPTGRLIGAPIFVISAELLPHPPAKLLAPHLRETLLQKGPMGVTTMVGRAHGAGARAFQLLDQAGELPVRKAYSLEFARFNPFPQRDMNRMMDNIQGWGSDWVWLTGIAATLTDGNPDSGDICSAFPKIRPREVDGQQEVFTECVSYWDLPGDKTREAVRLVAEHGYRVAAIHSFGDKSNEMAADLFKEVGAEGRRFALDHSLMFNPELIRKSGELGMYWSLSTAHFVGRRMQQGAYQFGNEVADRMFAPVRDLLEAGAKVTVERGGWPFYNMERLVTRVDERGIVRGARNAVDRETVLRMMTRWGAEYALREDRIGSIEPGKLADLVIVNRNPLDRTMPDDQIGESIHVLQTIVGGRVMYDRERDGAPPPGPLR